MTNHLPGFIFVHGAWHDQHTWDLVLPLLHTQGYMAEAIDLPGTGIQAKNPVAYHQRPLDPVAFATEPSPNADVTQAQYTAAVSDMVIRLAAQTKKSVILVGHSGGGTTISAVTERHPEQIAAVVYLAAVLLPNGVSTLANSQDPDMAQGAIADLLLADPSVVGAARIDWQSANPDYAARLKAVFYGDAIEETYRQFTAHLHPDEPVNSMIQPSPITPERFGTVPRHYIRTLADRAAPLAAQDYVIACVDATMPTATIAHDLPSAATRHLFPSQLRW